jgi:hypothetical protein
MQSSTTTFIITAILKEIDEQLIVDYRQDPIISDPPSDREQLRLTQEERDLITSGLPREIVMPFEPIRGTPSPISPMHFFEYRGSVSRHIATYIRERRHGVTRESNLNSNSNTTVILHYPVKRPQSSMPFKIDPANPIPTLTYLGLINHIVHTYGHGLKEATKERRRFRRLVKTHLLTSPRAIGTIQDHQVLYSMYVDAVFWSTLGLEYDIGFDYSTGLIITNRLYNPSDPKYTGFGVELDKFHLNWRWLPEILNYNHGETRITKVHQIITDVMTIIRKAVADEYAQVYAYGTPEYRRLADEWNRRVSQLTPNQDPVDSLELEQRVRKAIPQLGHQDLLQIVDQHQDILDNYNPKSTEYSTDDLLTIIQELIPYMSTTKLSQLVTRQLPST